MKQHVRDFLTTLPLTILVTVLVNLASVMAEGIGQPTVELLLRAKVVDKKFVGIDVDGWGGLKILPGDEVRVTLEAAPFEAENWSQSFKWTTERTVRKFVFLKKKIITEHSKDSDVHWRPTWKDQIAVLIPGAEPPFRVLESGVQTVFQAVRFERDPKVEIKIAPPKREVAIPPGVPGNASRGALTITPIANGTALGKIIITIFRPGAK